MFVAADNSLPIGTGCVVAVAQDRRLLPTTAGSGEGVFINIDTTFYYHQFFHRSSITHLIFTRLIFFHILICTPFDRFHSISNNYRSPNRNKSNGWEKGIKHQRRNCHHFWRHNHGCWHMGSMGGIAEVPMSWFGHASGIKPTVARDFIAEYRL
jgi:hypothetical protein